MKDDWFIEILNVLLGFIERNILWLTISVFLIISRKGIAGLIERIIKLNFSYGGASGGVEATAPSPKDESHKVEKTSPPSTTEQPAELKGKEEDAMGKEKQVQEEEVKNWFPLMQEALRKGDTVSATHIFEEHQREEKDTDQRYSNEAMFLYFLYIDGKERTALSRLEELHTRSINEKQIEFSAFWLSLCYQAMKDYNKQIKLWQDAISRVTDQRIKTTFILNLSRAYKARGEFDLGIELIEERLIAVVDQEQRAKFYQMLSTLEKEKGNNQAAALASEKVVELSPGNTEILFDAAYAQSQEKLNLLSLINYSTLLNQNERHAAALNNLAVCSGEFKFSGKQVELYQRAVNEKNTLAMANLANLLIDAGFWEEAKSILDKARLMEDPHENIGQALYRLQQLKNEQEEKWSALIKKADAFQRQVRVYGDAFFDRAAAFIDYSGAWFTKRGEEVTIKVNGQNITGEWIEAHGGIISTFKCSVSGTRRNRSAIIDYQRRPEVEIQSTLLGGSFNTSIKCYSYFSVDQQLWEFFSIEPEKELTLTLYRKTPTGN